MLVVGITGGLGTGKSLVTELLREQGAITFSADEAARAVLDPSGPTLRAIVNAFGTDVRNADGKLNRAYLASRVFADEAARALLNQLTHPPILRLLRAQIEACGFDFSPDSVVVVEVPLLFEAKMQDWFELIVVVSASQTMQVARVQARNQLSAEETRRRIAAQMPLEKKRSLADIVLHNEGNRQELEQGVANLWRQLRQKVSPRRDDAQRK